MSEPAGGQAPRDAALVSSASFPPASPLAAALSLLTIGACCLLLMQLDVPLLRFLRSLDLSSIQRAGDLGEKVGNGASLVAVSLCLLGFGWIARRKPWTQAGIESLLAHGCVGLLVNGLKHLIGRPRPRLTHSGEWQWWPSWESGLDSFPSGHTSATFAVVTVLARHWPRAAWVGYGLATWVAMSRVWRGSHFATDVVAGMVAGSVVGTIFASPLREWRETLLRAIVHVTPIAVIVTSTLWVVLHRVGNIWVDRVLSLTGLALLAAGLAIRLRTGRSARPTSGPAAYRVGIGLVGLGLSFMTGSLILVTLAGLALSAWWVHAQTPLPSTRPAAGGLYAAAILLAALLIFELKGIVPIR
ncbi:MAG TPA: phosphatase PAP2 family protein [Nitrospiraceae bacterium]|nr:phosphatase PAP2 family protein [Nitrospiraceae bacterium]